MIECSFLQHQGLSRSTSSELVLEYILCVYIHTHTHIYGMLLSHKKGGNNATCSHMGGAADCLTGWSKTQKDEYHMISLVSRIWKKCTDELIYGTEVESQIWKTNLISEDKGEGGINWEIGVDIYIYHCVYEIDDY